MCYCCCLLHLFYIFFSHLKIISSFGKIIGEKDQSYYYYYYYYVCFWFVSLCYNTHNCLTLKLLIGFTSNIDHWCWSNDDSLFWCNNLDFFYDTPFSCYIVFHLKWNRLNTQKRFEHRWISDGVEWKDRNWCTFGKE